MPWEQVWRPAPQNLGLPLLAALPDGVSEFPFRMLLREVFGGGKHFYHCDKCGGWVEGYPAIYEVNTLGPPCGREGKEYYCRRCGEEIGFFGVMA